MQVRINTDKNIAGDEELAAKVEKTLTNILERFTDRITRLEVHLGDGTATSPELTTNAA